MLIQFILFFALLVLVVVLEDVCEDLFGRLPRHPWFVENDSVMLPFETLLVTLLGMWLMARWIDCRHFSDFGIRFNPSWRTDLGVDFLFGAVAIAVILCWTESRGVAFDVQGKIPRPSFSASERRTKCNGRS